MSYIKDENINIIKEIPSIPDAFEKINEIIREQNNPIEEAVSYIENNEELKNDIMRLAKSRYFIMGQNLNSIKAIVITLGVMKIKNIIMTLTLKNVMDLNNQGFNDLWDHSIRCAIACEILANEFSIINPEDAFVLGFLHDIGKTIIYKDNVEAYTAIKERVLYSNEDVIAIENETFNTNHSSDGSMILKKWKMPRIITDCIACHHSPTLSMIPPASGIIYIADKIINSDKGGPLLENSLLNRLGLYINDVKNLKNNISVKSDFYFEAIN